MPLGYVMSGLVEHRRPSLVLALETVKTDVPHPATAIGGFLRRLADAGRPADLNAAGNQFVTERAAFRMMLEQRDRHVSYMPCMIEPTP
jgi:hypothetical protein